MKVAEVQLSYKTKVKASEREKISSSKSGYEILKPFYADYMEHREVSFALLMNKANKALGVFKLSEGGTSGTVIDNKLLFQAAILANASAIILSHNHPSGALKPSQADIRVTDKVKKAGELLDIVILDHLIITEEGYYSFADEGII